MKKTCVFLIFLLFFLLPACQDATPVTATRPVWTVVPLPAQTTGDLAITPTPSPILNAPATATVAGSTTEEQDLAVAAVNNYFKALEAGDFQAAADLYSNFSLTVAGISRAEAALLLQGEMARGSRWSSLEVKDSRQFDNQTMLVHVTYQMDNKSPSDKDQVTQTQVDELWPIRRENARWLYNRENLIDYRILDVAEQAMGGLIVKPIQLTRFSDHMTLTLMVQNTTNDAIVLGQANEIMAMFQFGDQQVEAVKKQMVFDRLRTNPQVAIEVLGLYETYPESVIIRQWKNYSVKPWFTFTLTD